MTLRRSVLFPNLDYFSEMAVIISKPNIPRPLSWTLSISTAKGVNLSLGICIGEVNVGQPPVLCSAYSFWT